MAIRNICLMLDMDEVSEERCNEIVSHLYNTIPEITEQIDIYDDDDE